MTLDDMKKLPKTEQKAIIDRVSKLRHNGKTAVYACQYGAGVGAIASGAGVTKQVAEALHKAYWNINWAVKAVKDEQKTKVVNGMTWQLNPVNNFWYVLRSEKDKISTLIQGTGTYCFDMWLKEILTKDVKLLGQFHDEIIFEIPKGYRVSVTKYLKDCVGKVNDTLKLNRDLDVDVDYGESYDKIH